MRLLRGAVRRFWFMAPVAASLATDCEDTPRGAVPTGIAEVEIRLVSRPAAPNPDVAAVEQCLDRMGGGGAHVRPSWRDDSATAAYDPDRVPLVERSANTFAATFRDAPVNAQLTLTVHDVNECRRNPVVPSRPGLPGGLGDGRVTSGVSANGVPLTRVVGNGALLLVVGPDGVVAAQ